MSEPAGGSWPGVDQRRTNPKRAPHERLASRPKPNSLNLLHKKSQGRFTSPGFVLLERPALFLIVISQLPERFWLKVLVALNG